MLMKRRNAAVKVARELFALEKAIDAALVQAAELSAVMPTATAEANLSAIVIQDAFERSAATFAALAQARRHVVETHNCLDDTKIKIGLRTLSFGGDEKPPPSGMLPAADENEKRAA
jgi:hypothetical protein